MTKQANHSRRAPTGTPPNRQQTSTVDTHVPKVRNGGRWRITRRSGGQFRVRFVQHGERWRVHDADTGHNLLWIRGAGTRVPHALMLRELLAHTVANDDNRVSWAISLIPSGKWRVTICPDGKRPTGQIIRMLSVDLPVASSPDQIVRSTRRGARELVTTHAMQTNTETDSAVKTLRQAFSR